MLCIKLDLVPTMPWTVTMIPCFLVLLFWTCAPVFGWVFRHHTGEFYVANLFLLLPTVIVVILLAIKLDGVHISIVNVFMPYWIVDGFILLVGTATTCTAAYRERQQDTSLFRSIGPFCATYSMGCLLLAPLVVFCMLLSIREYDDTLSIAAIFSPLIFWFVTASLISCCFARGLTNQNQLQVRREVEFSTQPRLIV